MYKTKLKSAEARIAIESPASLSHTRESTQVLRLFFSLSSSFSSPSSRKAIIA